VKKEILFSM